VVVAEAEQVSIVAVLAVQVVVAQVVIWLVQVL
jgi:hypothetical protein